MAAKDILRQLMTESDNVTHDLYRYLATLSVLVGLGLCIYATVTGKAFSIQDYGVGVGTLLAGAGAALFLKGKE